VSIDFAAMKINFLAKELAWNDLDDDDKRVYLREAQKKLAKDKHWLIEECGESIEKEASKYDTTSSKKKAKKK